MECGQTCPLLYWMTEGTAAFGRYVAISQEGTHHGWKRIPPKRFSAPAYYLHTVVCLLIMFGFGQLPPVEPLTPLGMNLIGIFLGVLYGWVCIEIVWPSLAGLLA